MGIKGPTRKQKIYNPQMVSFWYKSMIHWKRISYQLLVYHLWGISQQCLVLPSFCDRWRGHNDGKAENSVALGPPEGKYDILTTVRGQCLTACPAGITGSKTGIIPSEASLKLTVGQAASPNKDARSMAWLEATGQKGSQPILDLWRLPGPI